MVFVCPLSTSLTGLQELLNKKDMVGDVFNQLRLARQRGLNQTGVVRPRLQSMPPCSLPLANGGGKQAAAALGALLSTAVSSHAAAAHAACCGLLIQLAGSPPTHPPSGAAVRAPGPHGIPG